MTFLLLIYDFLASHRAVCWIAMLSCFVLFGIAAFCLDYKEDIFDFLPLTEQQKRSMDYYQQISRSDEIVIIFEGEDTDAQLEAVDCFEALANEKDSVIAANLMTRIDVQHYLDVIRWVYAHMPYFLTETDYARMDSVLQQTDAVRHGVENCHRIMQMPVSGFVRSAVSNDPLSLFTPLVSSLRDFQPVSDNFSSLDGYMLTEDERMAFAFCHSPYGASETGRNTGLVQQLEALCREVNARYPEVDVRLLGAPVIAVENASRIKQDSVIAIGLALVLIIAVLFYCFRKDPGAILLIVLTIAFGWLFAMAVISLTAGGISIIVLGVGSIIIGIAVNYPLHILFHRRYTSSVRQTLQEVAVPLVIGNITTVGAFITLIPLDAVALRDLGVFAASMLVGTIFFSLFFMPQLMKSTALAPAEQTESPAQLAPSASRPAWRYASIAAIVLITAVLGYVGRDLSFDADVTHINYMTPQQRADFAYFTSLAGNAGTVDIYMVEPQEAATPPDTIAGNKDVLAVHSPWRWLPDFAEQQRRLSLWNGFWETRRERLLQQLEAESAKQGFTRQAFAPFSQLLMTDWQPMSFDAFHPIADNILKGYWLADSTHVALVTRVGITPDRLAKTEQRLTELSASPECNVFDIRSLNASLANRLSDNFDYIGLVCSLLVFGFLWLSFRSLRSAVVAFLPMAVSWVWIIGMMHLLGLQFNIVNIILATFIFGQGDDYTIFVVEGLQYEHATGQRILPQFRRSIILSAVIMFVGIGVLVIAKHPAMFSLGAVTLIGMMVVVLMANIIPLLLKPLLFKKTKTR